MARLAIGTLLACALLHPGAAPAQSGTASAGSLGAAPPSPEAAATVPTTDQPPPPDPLRPAAVTFSFGLGGAASFGRVGGGLGGTSDWWSRGLTLIALDGGLRVTRHLALVLYVDVGVGDASASIMTACRAWRLECGVAAGRAGIQARYAFTPAATATTWISAGTGWEAADLTVERPADVYTINAPGTETVSFLGWEMVKLGVGRDWRLGRLLGFGLFASGSVGTFSKVTIDGPAYLVPRELGGRAVHAWILGGGRVVLCP